MKQNEYNYLSEKTEKRFPEGLTISANTALKLDMAMEKITSKSEFMDEMKKELIYQDHDASGDNTMYMTQAQIELLHASLGMITEAVEINQAVWGWIKAGKFAKLDVVNISEELADSRWYEAMFLRKLGLEPEGFMQGNIDKLKARYGEKFSNEAATTRDLDTEREILEASTERVELV